MSARSRAEWQIAFWSFFVAAFLAGSLQPFGSLLRQRRIDDQGPQNSSDAHLLSELGLSDGSRQIAECLRDVPLDARVALIYREGSLDDLPAQIISRLAWPRPVFQGNSPAPGIWPSKKVPAFLIGKNPCGGFQEQRVLSGSLQFGQLYTD